MNPSGFHWFITLQENAPTWLCLFVLSCKDTGFNRFFKFYPVCFNYKSEIEPPKAKLQRHEEVI